ncbi:MAG: PEP-CTERM sorting domain-containing protein, partial [Puniceicoccales bacterium]
NTLITGGEIARNGNLTAGTGASFNTKDWDEEAAGDYLSWSITVESGYQLDNLLLDIRLDRSGTGPSSLTLVWSDDGFSSSNTLASGIDPGEDGTSYLDLGGAFGTGIVGTIDFRLIGSGATSSSGTMDLEPNEVGPGSSYGLFISGGVSAVPEPGTYGALAGIMVLGFAFLRRRKPI